MAMVFNPPGNLESMMLQSNSEPCSVWQATKVVTLYYVMWRLVLLCFAFVLVSATDERPVNPHKSYTAFPSSPYLSSWVRWDSHWYYDIAQHGYYRNTRTGQSNVTFFPAYPYLARCLSPLTGSIFGAGLLLSHLATWFGLFFMFRLGTLYFSESTARLSLLLLLTFPGSLFFSAFYTESLFFAAAAGSLYFFVRQSFLYAGLLGCLAQLSRPVGLLIFATYALVLLVQWFSDRKSFRWQWLWIGLIPVGLVGFSFLLYLKVGDPLAWKNTQAAWGGKPTFPLWTPIRYLLFEIDYHFPRGWNKEGNIHHLLNALLGLGAIIACVWMVVRRYPLVLWLFVATGLAVTLYVGHLMSFNRHVVVLFPLFYLLAELCSRSRALERWLMFTFSFFLCFYLVRYLNWYWAG